MQIIGCGKCGVNNRVDPGAAQKAIAKCGKCGTPLDLSEAAPSKDDKKPIVVTDATLTRELENAGHLPVLVDAWAPWCGPCRMVGPVMDQLAAESNGRYKIAKLNVDDNPQTASRFQISSIPTLLIFRDGKLIDRMVGAQPKAAIAARLGQLL